ncbi:MAG TPA: hypothetical protein DDY98_02195 [Ruminococcaceae bacterium]|nr:hypothetical protein [Oscillospiraceae bacterium]
MKKVLAILTAMSILFAFSACGSKQDEPNAEETVPTTLVSDSTDPADYPGGLAEDGAEVLKTAGVDYDISLIEPATYWKQDVSTMEYSNDADDDCGISVWAKDTTDDNTTVCIQQIKDQTYKGTALDRTKSDEFSDKTFESKQIGDYTLYYAQYRENNDGYKEAHMFVDFNGCTLSFSGCYYDFDIFCEFLEATLSKLQVEKSAS